MDILKQSLEAADILSGEGDSGLPEDLMLELSQIEPVTSNNNNTYQTQGFNNTVSNVSNYVSNTLNQNVESAQSGQLISTVSGVQGNNNAQNIRNTSSPFQKDQIILQRQSQNVVFNNNNSSQAQIRVLQNNQIQQQNNVQLSVNNVTQYQQAQNAKPQQVMLVATSQAQQNGVYQLVNVSGQQQGNRTILPIKPMMLQQSNLNGRYVVSTLGGNSNLNIVTSQTSNQQLVSSSIMTSITTTAPIGRTTTVATCESVFVKNPSQIVTTTPSGNIFATKLPAGIRVVQQLMPTKTDNTVQQQSTPQRSAINANNLNMIGRKILTYSTPNKSSTNNQSAATLQPQQMVNTNNNSSGIIGVQLNHAPNTIQIVKPQQQLQQQTQFVKLDTRLPPRNTQIPIKGIQIASVNISLANENSPTSNIPAVAKPVPKIITAEQHKQNVKAIVKDVRIHQQPLTQNINSPTNVSGVKATITPIQQQQVVKALQAKLTTSPVAGSASSPGTGTTPNKQQQPVQVFRVDPTLTEEQAEEVRNLITSRTIVTKMRTLERQQQQLVLAFQAQIRSMSSPVQQYYLRNPQLFVQKVLQVTSTGKPFVLHVKRNAAKSNTPSKPNNVAGSPVPQRVKSPYHPTISLSNQESPKHPSSIGVVPKQFIRQAVKRPPPPASIPTNSLSLIMEQMDCHKKIVLSPDCTKPFKSTREALRRLLPYHVYNVPDVKPEHFKESEKLFDEFADKTMENIHRMYNKYHLLCLRDVTRTACSAEVVMVERIFLQQEKAAFERDKLKITSNPESVRKYFPSVKTEVKEEVKMETQEEVEVMQHQLSPVNLPAHNKSHLQNSESDTDTDSIGASTSNPHSSYTNHSVSSLEEESLLQAAVDSILS